VVAVDNYGLTTVDLQSISYKDDPWVVATDVAQVAYYVYPEDTKRHVVVSGKQWIVGADEVQILEQYNNYEEV
jgi:prophage antirepressor-like protein